MAVSLELTQSGSASTIIHAQKGDTITFQAISKSHDPHHASAIAGLGGLSQVTGVNFVLSTGGGAGSAMYLTQSGSGSNSIHLAAGDTVTVVLGAVVENDILASAMAQLQRLGTMLGVNFVLNLSGNAS